MTVRLPPSRALDWRRPLPTLALSGFLAIGGLWMVGGTQGGWRFVPELPPWLLLTVEVFAILLCWVYLLLVLRWLVARGRAKGEPVIEFMPDRLVVRANYRFGEIVVMREDVRSVGLLRLGLIADTWLLSGPMIVIGTANARVPWIQPNYRGEPAALADDIASWAGAERRADRTGFVVGHYT